MVRQEVEHSLVTRGSAEVCYPAPPVSPCSEWHWISTSRELVEHAKRFSNCAGSHHWKCLCGECAIYESRYEIGDEAIIVVLLKEGKRWRVSDILGPANSLVDEELAANAREYFEEQIALEGGNT